MATYRTTVGTVAASRKVHLAHGHDAAQAILCTMGGGGTPLAVEIAELPFEGGDTAVILRELKVTPRRLCGHCFTPRFRMSYARAWETAHV